MTENQEKLLPFSSGPAHISTYPLMKGGALGARPQTQEAGNTGSQWNDLPQGWTSDSRDKYAASMAQTQEGPVSSCMDKIDGHVTDPGAFCASLHDQVTGTTDWRGKGKQSESDSLMGNPITIGGILSPISPYKEADGGSAFPQVLRDPK